MATNQEIVASTIAAWLSVDGNTIGMNGALTIDKRGATLAQLSRPLPEAALDQLSEHLSETLAGIKVRLFNGTP